ncbi:hypothetical protein ILYODFUR_009678 [Ilyodon furcidens]|uniref:Uncharacterized protein n=1 Tax=Ilyodon furcidens TaxID=33524 RepID=A0ABV0T6M2_9TELE
MQNKVTEDTQRLLQQCLHGLCSCLVTGCIFKNFSGLYTVHDGIQYTVLVFHQAWHLASWPKSSILVSFDQSTLFPMFALHPTLRGEKWAADDFLSAFCHSSIRTALWKAQGMSILSRVFHLSNGFLQLFQSYKSLLTPDGLYLLNK